MRFLTNAESINVQFQLPEDDANLITSMEKSLQSLEVFKLRPVMSSLAKTDSCTTSYRFLGSIQLDKSLPPVELLMVQENKQVLNNHPEKSLIKCFQSVEVFLQVEPSSHNNTLHVFSIVEKCLTKILQPKATNLMCRKCHTSDPQVNGFFSLMGPLSSKSVCTNGHLISPEEEQMFSGISRDYESFTCPPNAETSILGGAMLINCADTGLNVKARLIPFETFDVVAKNLAKDDEVGSHQKFTFFVIAIYRICLVP